MAPPPAAMPAMAGIGSEPEGGIVVVDEVVVDELEVTLLELAGAVVVEEDNKSLSKLVDITAVSLIARDSDRETNSKLDG